MILKNSCYSPIEKISFQGFEFYLKRDDLLGPINGNKARKLAFYISQNYPKNQRFISYGGVQSNALEALSIFTKQKGFSLLFACDKIPNFLKENPCGNYAFALKNKVEIKENLNALPLREFALSLCRKDDIFIEQGVANLEAEIGFKELSTEILSQSKALGVEFDIFLPSGTGTSAAFLAKNLPFEIYTCACVGDEAYLKKQILSLLPDFEFKNLHILKNEKKYHFAKPYLEFYTLYKEFKSTCGVELDLLYDMLGLSTVLKHSFSKTLLYIHQGGLKGNTSMLKRYELKFKSNCPKFNFNET